MEENKEENLIGQKFDKLEVIDYHFSETGRQIICTVQCECGSEPRDIPLYLLTSGNTKSCGCSRKGKEINPKMGKPKMDIIGMKLNKLTVISEDEETKAGVVRCECGTEYTIPNIRGRVATLRKNGMCKKCRAKERPKKYTDIEPKTKFDYLTVIKRVEDNDYGEAQYECRCQCGTKKIVTGKNLANRKTKSCGCIKSQSFNSKKIFNGLTATPVGKKLYEIWSHYLLNIENPPSVAFKKRIVDKGIKFFPEWSKEKDGFIKFYKWAILKKEPFDLVERKFLVRIDEDKDFTPENCYFSRVSETKRASM